MKIPEFKPSKRFLGDTDLQCLVAKVKNSKLPGIAFRHIAKYKKDPVCEIHLRGKDHKRISAWQRDILEQLFEKESLAPAIEEAMREYEATSDSCCDMTKQERREVQKIGIAPFMTLSLIVIDGIKKEAILSARTELDGNLIEHGISIYLRKSKWRFQDRDYFACYRAAFGTEFSDRMAEAESELREQAWDDLFPPPNTQAPVEKDGSLIYGRWELDGRETSTLLKRLGSSAVAGVGWFHDISATKRESFLDLSERRLLWFERRGNWVEIAEEVLSPEFMKGRTTIKFWCDGKRLVQAGGLVYRRAAIAKRKPKQAKQLKS